MPARRLLLVTGRVPGVPSGGREMLSALTRDVLRELYGDRLDVVELQKPARRGPRDTLRALRGHIDGVDEASIARVVEAAARADAVFLDGSNLGELARAVKRAHPRVEVCTLFHNVEARFFAGSLRHERSIHALGVLAANHAAERKAVRHSDKRVCLSARDGKVLEKLYGRGETHVAPIAVEDRLDRRAPAPSREGHVLFVGGTFYANRDGIAWFVENVAPRIRPTTCIVGKGFESLRPQLERPGKVEVIGGVDDLGPWYAGASVVVAPIFDGSGMKTKVAEALMFGKRVIGTPDAFAGYEAVAARAGDICATADEFVAAIEAADASHAGGLDEGLRALYEKEHSRAAWRSRLAAILEAP